VDRHGLTAARWAAATPADVRNAALSWLTSKALAALAVSLGGPVIRQVPRDLPAFLIWTTSTLDLRRGAERHQAARARFTPADASALIDAAGPLGMLRSAAPASPRYDTTVILGGTVTGNLLRAALAARLPEEGVTPGQIVALAAHRPLTAAEIAAAPHPLGETTEWQHLFAVVCDAFGAPPAQPPGQHGLDFQTAIDLSADVTGHDRAVRRPVRLLAAPTSDRTRRANTADAFGFLARQIPAGQRRHVLVITSAIYVPYQFMAAAPGLLAADSSYVEMIGTPTATDGGRNLTAQRIGQEIHAAVTAAAKLWP
jgi:hypothetical protein